MKIFILCIQGMGGRRVYIFAFLRVVLKYREGSDG